MQQVALLALRLLYVYALALVVIYVEDLIRQYEEHEFAVVQVQAGRVYLVAKGGYWGSGIYNNYGPLRQQLEQLVANDPALAEKAKKDNFIVVFFGVRWDDQLTYSWHEVKPTSAITPKAGGSRC